MKVEATTNKAGGKKHNTRSVAAKVLDLSGRSASTLCHSIPTKPHVGEQYSQSDEDIYECSFCYGENCEDGKEWLQVCL